MAKARPCPKCGTYYNPKFGGNFQECFTCTLKEKIKETNTPTVSPNDARGGKL